MFELAIMLLISAQDLFRHRITHLSLTILIIVGLLDSAHNCNVGQAITTLCCGFLLFLFAGVGGGDIKLATILVLLFVPQRSLIRYWEYVSLLALLAITLQLLSTRKLRSNIPLAPVLCGAVLLQHLVS